MSDEWWCLRRGGQYRRVVRTALGRWVVCGGCWCGVLGSEVMVEVAVCFLSASEEATLGGFGG